MFAVFCMNPVGIFGPHISGKIQGRMSDDMDLIVLFSRQCTKMTSQPCLCSFVYYARPLTLAGFCPCSGP